MTHGEETVGTLAFCGVSLVAIAFVADEGNALAVFAFLGLPLALFLGVAYLTGTHLAPGWLSGTTAAFIAVAAFEGIWETYLHTGPNSMPGFVFLFMSVPLSLLALAPARAIMRRLHGRHILFSALIPFAIVFIVGSAPVVWSLAKQRVLL
jgi:hypothetical protein